MFYTHTSIYSKINIKYWWFQLQITFTWLLVWFTEPRPVTLSVSLHTQLDYAVHYSSPKHKSLFPKCLIHFSYTSVHSNLEHGFVILTESFSPLWSELHNPFCRHPNEKCVLTYATPFYMPHSQLAWSGLSRFEPPTANHNWYWQMLKRKYNVYGNSHYVTHYL